MKKNIITKGTKLLLLISTVIAFTTMPLIANAGTKKNDLQVWTAYEGQLKLYVKNDQKVKKGQLLFFVEAQDPCMFPEELTKEKHSIEFAKVKYARYKKLVKTHAVSEEAYQDAWQDYVTAVDTYNLTKGKIREAHYYAPYDGTVKDILYPNDSGIGDGNPVLTLVKDHS
ncbi:MAG TPA: hypothetical protein QF753_20015 [Victivallales bacterium]|nr:hypothetical protein [Victivallales bacterium]